MFSLICFVNYCLKQFDYCRLNVAFEKLLIGGLEIIEVFHGNQIYLVRRRSPSEWITVTHEISQTSWPVMLLLYIRFCIPWRWFPIVSFCTSSCCFTMITNLKEKEIFQTAFKFKVNIGLFSLFTVPIYVFLFYIPAKRHRVSITDRQRTASPDEIKRITSIVCKDIPPGLNLRGLLVDIFQEYGEVVKVSCHPDSASAIIYFTDHVSVKCGFISFTSYHSFD